MIPKVEIEAGKADLIREILGVNDLQDINLLDEYRDIFIKSQKSVYGACHNVTSRFLPNCRTGSRRLPWRVFSTLPRHWLFY